MLFTVTKEQNIKKKKKPRKKARTLQQTTGLIKVVQRESYQKQSTFTPTI